MGLVVRVEGAAFFDFDTAGIEVEVGVFFKNQQAAAHFGLYCGIPFKPARNREAGEIKTNLISQFTQFDAEFFQSGNAVKIGTGFESEVQRGAIGRRGLLQRGQGAANVDSDVHLLALVL